MSPDAIRWTLNAPLHCQLSFLEYILNWRCLTLLTRGLVLVNWVFLTTSSVDAALHCWRGVWCLSTEFSWPHRQLMLPYTVDEGFGFFNWVFLTTSSVDAALHCWRGVWCLSTEFSWPHRQLMLPYTVDEGFGFFNWVSLKTSSVDAALHCWWGVWCLSTELPWTYPQDAFTEEPCRRFTCYAPTHTERDQGDRGQATHPTWRSFYGIQKFQNYYTDCAVPFVRHFHMGYDVFHCDSVTYDLIRSNSL